MLETLMIFATLGVVLSGLGLVLATSSFIGGLQLIKGLKGSVEGKIHKFNGFSSLLIYIALALSSLVMHGVRPLALLGWVAGLGLILFKLRIIRGRNKRAIRYVPWLGVCILTMWLYLLYINMSV